MILLVFFDGDLQVGHLARLAFDKWHLHAAGRGVPHRHLRVGRVRLEVASRLVEIADAVPVLFELRRIEGPREQVLRHQ